MNVQTRIPSNGGDWLDKFGGLWHEQAESLRQEFGGTIQAIAMPPEARTDVPIVYVERRAIVSVLGFLRDKHGYNFLSDLTATDETPDEPRFLVVYNLYSIEAHCRIRVKVRVNDGEEVPSITSLWLGANWAEREVFDMFGIRFMGHPDLRRIVNDSRWIGHPLRKDYPIRKYQIFTDAEPPNPELLK